MPCRSYWPSWELVTKDGCRWCHLGASKPLPCPVSWSLPRPVPPNPVGQPREGHLAVGMGRGGERGLDRGPGSGRVGALGSPLRPSGTAALPANFLSSRRALVGLGCVSGAGDGGVDGTSHGEGAQKPWRLCRGGCCFCLERHLVAGSVWTLTPGRARLKS